MLGDIRSIKTGKRKSIDKRAGDSLQGKLHKFLSFVFNYISILTFSFLFSAVNKTIIRMVFSLWEGFEDIIDEFQDLSHYGACKI